MAQGTFTRLTYERLGILLTDAPAYKENGTQYNDLIRVQGMNYGFSHQALDVKSIGSDRLVTRNNLQSPIVRAPDVNCEIEYLFAEGQNELNANLYIGEDSSILKNFFNISHTDDINIIVVASDEDSHKDINFLDGEANFEDYNVIGIGNAFLANYRYNASVGALSTCSLSYAASNMKFDVYQQADRPVLPAIKLGVENTTSTETLAIDGSTFDEQHDPEISAVKPGDIKVKIIKSVGARGGADLESVDAAIQNVSIDVPIPRQDIYGMGSNYVFNRKLKLPIIGQLGIDMVLRGYTQDQVESFLTDTDVFDIKIDHPVSSRAEANQGDTYLGTGYFFVAVRDDLWKSAVYTVEVRAAGTAGDVELDGDNYYICIDGADWAKIDLVASTLDRIGELNDVYFDDDFYYIKSSAAPATDGWKQFALSSVSFYELVTDDAFEIANNITFEINRAQLKEQSYSHAIGSDVMVSSSLTFDVTKDDGLKLYFRFIPRVAPSWATASQRILYNENDTIAVPYTNDLDGGDSKVYYTLIGDDSVSFLVDEDGVVTFIDSPNYESGKTVYEFTIVATNDVGSDKKDIVVDVVDIPDVPPVWTLSTEVIDHDENDASPLEYNTGIFLGDRPVTYSLSGLHSGEFNIDAGNAEIIFTGVPDYETQTQFDIKVLATSDSGQDIKDLRIHINDIIDVLPKWDQATESIYYQGEEDKRAHFTNDADPSDGSILGYALSDVDAAQFTLNPQNDAVIFDDHPDYQTKASYTVGVDVENEVGTATKTLTIYIMGQMIFNNGLLSIRIDENVWGTTAYTQQVRAAGADYDREISADGNFLYICVSGTTWASIPLVDSDIGLVGFSVGHLVFRTDFVHINTNSGWKKFAIAT